MFPLGLRRVLTVSAVATLGLTAVQFAAVQFAAVQLPGLPAHALLAAPQVASAQQKPVATGTGKVGEAVTVTPDYDALGIEPANVTIRGGSLKQVIDGQGTWEVDTNGMFTFTPVAGFLGDPDPARFQSGERVGTVAAAYEQLHNGRTYSSERSKSVNSEAKDLFTGMPSAWTKANGGPVTFTLVDGNGSDIGTSRFVDGWGTFAVDPGTGRFTYTPVSSLPDDAPAGEAPRYGIRAVGTTAANGKEAGLTVWYQPVVEKKIALPDNVEVTAKPGAATFTPKYPEGVDPKTVQFEGGATELTNSDGTWKVSNGTFTFSPKQGLASQPEPIRYTATGAGTATLRLVYALAPVAPAELQDLVRLGATGQPVTQQPNYPPSLDTASVRILDGDREVTELVVPGEGTWNVRSGGVFVFTPEAGLNHSPAPISYTARNVAGFPYAAPGTVRVVYPEGREAPVLPDARAKAVIGEHVIVKPEYTGVIDGTSARLIRPDGAEDTELRVDGQGTWTVSDGFFTFLPADGFKGNPTPLRYTASDKYGVKAANPATVTVTYEQPGAVALSLPNSGRAGESGKPVTQTPSYADNIDRASVRIRTKAGEKVTELKADGGTWKVKDGTFTFTPQTFLPVAKSPEPIEYIANDTDGVPFTRPAEITVAYPAQSRPEVPNSVAVGAVGEAVTQRPPLGRTVNVSSLRIVDLARGEVTELAVEGQGTWTVAGGSFTFVPEPGFKGDPWPIHYTAAARDGQKASNVGIVSVRYFDPQPTTELPSAGTVGEPGKPVSLTPPFRSDIDRESVRIVGDGEVEVTRLEVAGQGTWSVSGGTFTFTPATGFMGSPDPVRYTAKNVAGDKFKDSAPVVVVYPAAGGEAPAPGTGTGPGANPGPAPAPAPAPSGSGAGSADGSSNGSSGPAAGWGILGVVLAALAGAAGGILMSPVLHHIATQLGNEFAGGLPAGRPGAK